MAERPLYNTDDRLKQFDDDEPYKTFMAPVVEVPDGGGSMPELVCEYNTNGNLDVVVELEVG